MSLTEKLLTAKLRNVAIASTILTFYFKLWKHKNKYENYRN